MLTIQQIEAYRMSGGREEHFARKEAIENELVFLNTAAIHLDLIEEAMTQGLQIIPYPIYTEPKHSVLVQKKRLDKPDDEVTTQIWCIKQYKDYPNELCATLAAIENVLQQIKESSSV
jgi:hypothetical protein